VLCCRKLWPFQYLAIKYTDHPQGSARNYPRLQRKKDKTQPKMMQTTNPSPINHDLYENKIKLKKQKAITETLRRTNKSPNTTLRTF